MTDISVSQKINNWNNSGGLNRKVSYRLPGMKKPIHSSTRSKAFLHLGHPCIYIDGASVPVPLECVSLLKPSLQDQIKEVKRELRMREYAYPKWVASRKLKPEDADRRIDLMKAVLETLEGLKKKSQQTNLFGE